MTCSVTPQTRRPRRPGAGPRRGRARCTSMPGSSWTASQRGDERPGDLLAGGVAAGVGDPVAVVAALAGQRDLAVRRHGRTRRRGRPARAPAPGPRCTSARDRARRRRRRRRPPACRAGARSGESAGSSAAAMPPWAHSVDPSYSTVLVTSSTRSTRWRSRSAAVSPAMPEPTTMTSAEMVQPGSGAAQPAGRVSAHALAPGRSRSMPGRCRRRPPAPRRRGPRRTGTLSISRVVPTRAATASRASPRYHSGTSSQGLRVHQHEVVHQRPAARRTSTARAARRTAAGPRPRPSAPARSARDSAQRRLAVAGR